MATPQDSLFSNFLRLRSPRTYRLVAASDVQAPAASQTRFRIVPYAFGYVKLMYEAFCQGCSHYSFHDSVIF